MLRECGSLDAGDLVIELERLLDERADVRGALSERFPFLMVDELEDAGAAHRALIEALGAEHGNLVCACDGGQSIRRPPPAVRGPGALVHGPPPGGRARRPRPPPALRPRDRTRLRRWPALAEGRSAAG